MSLVAYDNSDDSEDEKVKISSTSQKKAKDCVKIRIPSLKEFEDEEDIPVVKKPKMQSGSGLFSLLPPPKNSPSLCKPGFVPYVLSSNKGHTSLAAKESKNFENTIVVTPSISSETQESDNEIPHMKDKITDEKDNASALSDFFWLDDLASGDKRVQKNEDNFSAPAKNTVFRNLSQLPAPSNSDMQPFSQNESNEVPYLEQSKHLPEANALQTQIKAQQTSSMGQSNLFQSYSINESTDQINEKEYLLKDKEFLKLQGRRHEFESIDIIDVNADDQLTDKNEWLMKSLTEESTHKSSRRKGNMPTQQQKRKHQITYLAFQAKERENDLKNQWSLNSRSRRETQAKYGF